MLRSLVTVAALASFGGALVSGQSGDGLNADTLKALTFRNLGPTLNTGRVVDVEIDPRNPNVWYVASAFGGVWKTVNRGITFDPIFANYHFTTCCVVVDPKDSNIVWVGTGENNSQRSAHFGDGVYKSTDAGKTFTNMGLKTSEHIGKILVDPRNSNTVWVASQGPLFTEGGERGLYKTTDGGKTWTAALTISKDTGISDIAFDPVNPDIIYAGSYQRRRHVGQMIGGGPEGGIWKSMNGGKTFTKLSNGLPKGDVGRIALAVDPKGLIAAAVPAREAKPAVPAKGTEKAIPAQLAKRAVPEKRGTIVYAIVHATETERGFYRSLDGGLKWEKMSGYVGGGAAYYCELFIDPWRQDTIWSVNTPLEWSRDGGKTFSPVPNMSNVLYQASRGGGPNAPVNMEQNQYVHVDFHDVTFDPTNADHILASSDGGVHETYDGGGHWRPFTNLPIQQFYKIAVDDAKPFYRVCGGAQDNFSVCGPSRTDKRWGIQVTDWFYVSSGDGFQPRVDPSNQNIIYGQSQNGSIVRNDFSNNTSRGVRPRAGGPGQGGGGRGGGRGGAPDPTADRPNWDAPYIISPHSPSRLYWASQYVWRSDDRGDTWTKISPDLTRDLDWTVLPIMGRVWDVPPQGAPPSLHDPISLHESTTALSNVVALEESPLLEGLIYTGSDDGLLQITEDGGKNWRKVDAFPGVPKWAYVSDIFASPRDENVVFVAFNDWQRGNYAPYIVKSTDRGRTFTSITGNLPEKHDVWGIIQDHINGDLLFAATEFGVFTSVDGGKAWVQLKGNMPVAQVRDIQVQKRYSDLVLGTFGRGFWVLDDYSPLRAMTSQTLAEEARLYPTRENVPLYSVNGEGQQTLPVWTAPNPEFGATLTYSVGKAIAADAKLVITITDDAGKQIKRMEVPKELGLHREAWNLRADPGVTQAGGPGLAELPPVPTDDDDQDDLQTPPVRQNPPAGRQGGAGAAQGGRQGGARAAGAPAAGQGRGGGPAQGPIVTPGRYTATLGKQVGETVTPYGEGVKFFVKTLER
jgi:photosystem II stability/assembly factor-like uncharacterized protein